MTRPRQFLVFLALLVVGVIMGSCYDPGSENGPGWFSDRPFIWVAIFVLVLAAIAWLGYCLTRGDWRGALIDGRNKISLSRLQEFVWTALIMSALLAATLTNAQFAEGPILVDVPEQIWLILGITTTTTIAAPAILTLKAKRKPNADEYKKTAKRLFDEGAKQIVKTPDSIVLTNTSPKGASWLDLFRGEEAGTGGYLDMAKVQMFFITVVVLFHYGIALYIGFQAGDLHFPLTSLPPVDESMTALLSVSHAGYLAGKVAPRSLEA